MPDSNGFPTYEEWKRLTDDEREYQLHQTLAKVNGMYKRFAAKWVERAVYGVIVIVLSAFVYGVVNVVIPARTNQSHALTKSTSENN